jgi:hypothetical protein
LSDKIKFHHLRIFSIKERFNGDTSHSEERIIELTSAQKTVQELIKEAKAGDFQLEVVGEVTIKFISKP